ASTVAPRLVLYSTTVRAQPRLLFFSQPPATPELYTLSLHDALPILALPALELATGFVDHPFANANDQASLFGQRNEAVRHDQLRSEEHTSELQSRENLVCRLLLEKKKGLLKNAHSPNFQSHCYEHVY